MFDKLCMKVAYWLPRRLAYWCAIRVGAHGTICRYSSQIVPELTFMEALKRWEGK